MKVSTKGRYGLTAMIDISMNAVSENVTIKSISERQNISEGYLEQIFSSLRKAGLVKSIKGAQGGYLLGKSSSEITVGEILRALEGDLSVSGQEENDLLQEIIREKVWSEIDKGINNVIDSITLEHIVFEFRKRNDSSKFMYYI